MKFRKLRIAWSLLSGLACVLLVVLWVRSYWWCDQYHLQGSRWFGGLTNRGLFALHWLDVSKRDSVETGYHCYSIDLIMWKQRLYWCSVLASPEGYELILPIWFPAAMIAFLAAAPWLRWQFSLRTLLIATTLVAVVLGLIACLE